MPEHCHLGSNILSVLHSHEPVLKLSVLYKVGTSTGTILRKQNGGLLPRSDPKERLTLHWHAKGTKKPKGWPFQPYLASSWNLNLLRNDEYSARPESSKRDVAPVYIVFFIKALDITKR